MEKEILFKTKRLIVREILEQDAENWRKWLRTAVGRK